MYFKIMIARFLSWFFYHLYHSFSWAYDLVAYLVSGGKWFRWGELILEYLDKEDKILELGFGTGHLITKMAVDGFSVHGIDESIFMAKRTQRWLDKHGQEKKNIVQGNVNAMPFKSAGFSKLISVFPSEYPFSRENQKEIKRCLCNDGIYIMLLAVQFLDNSPLSIFYRIIYRILGRSPGSTDIDQRIVDQFKDEFNYVRVEKKRYNNAELVIFLVGR